MLDHKYDGSLDQLFGWGGPVIWVPTKHPGLYKNAVGTPEMGPIPCNRDFRPVRKKEKLERLEEILDELNLGTFVCVYCNSVGTLTNDWPEGETTCPRCGKQTLQNVGSYIT
jgi:hypothetical protein